MSTSKDPVANPIPLDSAETGAFTDVSSAVVLAPKSPNPKIPATTETHDGHSLVSPIEATEVTNITSDSFTEVPNLVEIISKVLATTLHELKAVQVSPHVSVKSTSSPTSSISKHLCHVPPLTKVAEGPPSDPSVEASLNFAARKAFHMVKPTSDVPTTLPSLGSSEDQKCSQPSDVSNNGDSFTDHQSSNEHSVFSHHSGPDDSAPHLAPKSIEPHTQPSSAPYFSPKPMVSFDVAKWTQQIKGVTIDDESYGSIISWYDMIQQGMIIASNKQNVMPELRNLYPTFSFANHILPPRTSSVYKSGYMEYCSMSKALRVHITHPSTIAKCCTVLISTKELHDEEHDGFVLLLKILGGVFPHLGGPHLDIVGEISSITARKSETFRSLLRKFVSTQKKLRLSGHHVPATALFEKYMNIIKSHNQVFSLISPIHRSFHAHLKKHGPDVVYPHYTIKEVHEYLKDSGVDPDSLIGYKPNQHQLVGQAHAANVLPVLPQAHAAKLVDHEMQGPQYFLPDPQANAASMALGAVPSKSSSRPRHPPCPVCFQRHPPLHCWARGSEYQPTWLMRNVEKYNALHKNEKVEPSYKDQSPPLRRPTFQAQANKSVTFDPRPPTPPLPHAPQEDVSVTPQYIPIPDSDSLSSTSAEENHHSVTHPTCNMAKFGPDTHVNDDESFLEA